MSFDCKYNYPQIARDSGFELHQCRDGLMDWQFFGSLEVDEILREQQFEKIDAALSYLSEAPVAPALEINILDSRVGKYFFISQLAIQYLIFCRKFLDESVKALRSSVVKMEAENLCLKALNTRQSNEIVQLHKQISQMKAINDIVFPCQFCTKNFVSNDALNIHLSKKHTNTPNDIQVMNNDRTLINTIKLELEIKQLKERLNNAEKYIRETTETKKCSPRICTKISSSTQIDTIKVDIGTQCNLFETKEFVSSVDEINLKSFISELQAKILTLESWQEAHRVEKKESIDDITKTLKKINESLHSRCEQDLDNLKKIVEDVLSSKFSNQIIPTSTMDLQAFLSSTVSDLMQQNSKNLNTILNKIETIYEEKLVYSKFKISPETIKSQEMIFPPSSTIEVQPNKKIDLLTAHNDQTYSLERSHKNCYSNEKELTDSSLDISAQVPTFKDTDMEEISSIIKNSDTPFSDKILEQEMASYGVTADAQIISAMEAANISSQLIKHRSNMQKMNPKFITTRNKLKNFVNKLSIKNSHTGNVHKYSLKAFEIQLTNLRNPTSKTDGSIENDSFKNRLEKILCSPIKKPSIYTHSYTIDSIKPVPLPRKRVMFQHTAPKTSMNE